MCTHIITIYMYIIMCSLCSIGDQVYLSKLLATAGIENHHHITYQYIFHRRFSVYNNRLTIS